MKWTKMLFPYPQIRKGQGRSTFDLPFSSSSELLFESYTSCIGQYLFCKILKDWYFFIMSADDETASWVEQYKGLSLI